LIKTILCKTLSPRPHYHNHDLLLLFLSYIYDPSAGVEVGKNDAPGPRGSLYQPQRAGVRGGGDKQKEGVNNLAYSKSNEGTLKLEADNNHLNHRQQQSQLGASAPAGPGGGLYIIQPQAPGPRWNTDESHRPSLVPVYPEPLDYGSGGGGGGGGGGGSRSPAPPAYHQSEPARGWEPLGDDEDDEDDEGVGDTPDYTGDESESVLSVDIHTSTTSVSSTDTRDGGLRWPAAKTPDASTAESGISVMKSEDEEEEEQEERQTRRTEEEEKEEEEKGGEGGEDVRSVTDSMVAEALAALEDATAGEDFE